MRGAAWMRVAAGVVAAVTLAGCTGASSPAPAGTSATPGAAEGAIELQQFDFGGDFGLGNAPQRFTLAEHRGEVVLLFFGYTYCPDICPTTLGTIARAQELLGADRDRTFAAFVSVDPQRDTPARLEEYTRHFGIRGTGVTGSKAEIDAVVAQYGAYYELQPSASALGYMVDHTSRIFLIDQAGKVRYLFRSTDRPEVIAAGIRTLLTTPVS